MIDKNMRTQDILHEYPESYGVILKHGLMPCCGRNPPLKEAVDEAGKDLDLVLKELNGAIEE